MKAQLDSSDRRQLEALLNMSKALEESAFAKAHGSEALIFNPTETHLRELNQLILLINGLDTAQDPLVKKLKDIATHLHPHMSLQHFLNFMVPIERLLDRNLADHDWPLLSTDRPLILTPQLPLVFVLDHLRSSFNVGSIYRLAETLNISEIFLVGYTPTPESAGVKKTAMGTESQIKTQIFRDETLALQNLHERGIQVLALEVCDQSESIYAPLPTPAAFWVGNERFGISNQVLKSASSIRMIPLRGQKNSLNVAQSLAVASFEWSRQHGALS